jgi:prepilin-type N-terminal cleavage/methylation domain-containing protein
MLGSIKAFNKNDFHLLSSVFRQLKQYLKKSKYSKFLDTTDKFMLLTRCRLICSPLGGGQANQVLFYRGEVNVMRKKTGFTLIELMIVVAIIGILAAVAIPRFAQMLEKSREGATKGNIGAIKSAISIYTGDQAGAYPYDLTGWFQGGAATSYMDNVPFVKVTASNTFAQSHAAGAKCNPSRGGNLVHPAGHSTMGDVTYIGYGWRYDSISGNVWVNNILPDSTQNEYTTYGY